MKIRRTIVSSSHTAGGDRIITDAIATHTNRNSQIHSNTCVGGQVCRIAR